MIVFADLATRPAKGWIRWMSPWLLAHRRNAIIAFGAAVLGSAIYDVQSGTVRVDGSDVRDLTLASLRRQVGVVFEESFLFSDTIRANIAYGRPDATPARWRRRPEPPRLTSSSWSCPPVTTPKWDSVALPFREGSGSRSRWPGRC
jgi:hypothetical protein